MIEEKFGIEKKEKEEYPVIPVDVYAVELVDVSGESVETYDSKQNPNTAKEMETVYKFEFKFLEGYDSDGKSIVDLKITKKFVPNYFWIGKNGKNLLYKITEAFKGSALTQAEVENFDVSKLNALIGKQIRVGIEHKQIKDGIYCNITSFYPAKFEPTSAKEADTTNPDDHHLNADKNPIGQDVPVIQVDEEDLDLSQIPF